MDKKKLIDKIKDQLKSLISPEKEVKFARVKAGELMISTPDEELTIGSEVMVLDEEGMGNPLTDGKYVLDSGIEIVVEAGKVKEMMEKKEEESEIEVTVESGKMEKEKEMAYGYDVKMEEKVAKLEEKVMALMEKMNKMLGDNEMIKKEMSVLASSPSTTAIETKSVEFRSVEDKKNGAGLLDIMSIRDRARKNNR
jgi:hypothetical protein